MHGPKNGSPVYEVYPVKMQEYKVSALIALLPPLRAQVRLLLIILEAPSEIFDRHKSVNSELGYVDHQPRTCYFRYKSFI